MLKIKLRKWGNSYGLRIPKQIMQMLSIKPDQEFKVEVKDDVIKLIKLEASQRSITEVQIIKDWQKVIDSSD